MINMGNDRHVTDVVFKVHNPAELISCKLHLQGHRKQSNLKDVIDQKFKLHDKEKKANLVQRIWLSGHLPS